MNWEVRNPLHCTTDGCTAKAEIEALRARVAALEGQHEFNHSRYLNLCREVAALTVERDTLNAALDAKITICGDANLAVAQARIVELREHLALAVLYGPPMAIGNVLSKDVLATPDDSSVLDAALEEAYSNGYDVGCTDTMGDT